MEEELGNREGREGILKAYYSDCIITDYCAVVRI